MIERPRRLRKNKLTRDLIQEPTIGLNGLIQPYFLMEKADGKTPIKNFTGVSRWGVDKLSTQIEADLERGVTSFLLFGEIEDAKRDATGSAAYADRGVIPESLLRLKSRFGERALFFTDVCLCPATDHGHCGVIENDSVENDKSLEFLSKMAVCHAQAGADFVAPSDMMDGRVGHMRKKLDESGFTDVGLMAYTAKYSSSYYGPFREALGSSPKASSPNSQAPRLSDRSTYQMDFRSSREALRELRLDVAEGADIVMVKPALAYLDIISLFRQNTDLPVAAYSVSGEYEMMKQMAALGLVDEKKFVLENLTAIRRSGADIIITYYASEAAEKGWLR